jgi:hypothetical protein
LPAYLTESDIEMTEAYLNSSFLAGQPYDLEKATKGSSEKITFIGIEFVDTDKNQFELNVWNKNYILSVISSYYLQNSINSYQKFLNTAEVYYDSTKISDGVTYLFNKLIQFSNRQTNGELKIFPFNSEGKLNFESVFTNYDTWYEWNKNQ